MRLLVVTLLVMFAAVHSQGDTPPLGPLPPVEPVALENAHRLQKLAALGTGTLNFQVVWSPDGVQLAVPSSAGVWLYDAEDWDAPPVLLATPGIRIESAAYHPGGGLLFGGGSQRIFIWDMTTHSPINTLEAGLSGIAHLQLSPDGTRLAAADYQTGVGLWQITPGGEGQQLNFVEAPRIQQIRFTPDGAQLYAGLTRDSRQVIIMDALTGDLLAEPPPVSPALFELDFDFSPDGRLVAGQLRGELQIWDRVTGDHLQTLPVERSYDMKFLADSRHLLVSVLDQGLKVWDATSGEKLRDLPGTTTYSRHIAPAPGEQQIAYGALSSFEVWSLETDENLMQQSSEVTRVREGSIAFSPAGELYYANDDSSSRGLWRVDLQGRHVEQLASGFMGSGLAFTPDADWLLAGGNPLRLWYLPEPVLAAVYPHEFSPTVAFHPDGQSYVSGGSVVRIWDFETRTLIRAVGERFGFVEALAFNADGTLLVSVQRTRQPAADGSPRWTAVLWDTSTYEPVLVLEDRKGPLAFQPGEGRLLLHECIDPTTTGLCQQQVAHLVDGATGDVVYTLPYDVVSPVFSADGSFMVGGTVDGDLVMWDMARIGQLARWPAHSDNPQVALSADSRYIVTAGTTGWGDGLGWVWGVPEQTP